MHLDTQAIHALRVHFTEGLKDTGRSLQARKRPELPKRFHFRNESNSFTAVPWFHHSQQYHPMNEYSRITTMVSAKAVEQEADASKMDPFYAAVGMAAERFPTWCDAKKIIPKMTRRKIRSSKQVCRSNFHRNAKHLYANNRYSTAFKKATSEASALQQQKKKKKPTIQEHG